MKKFVYVVGGGANYYRPFEKFGKYNESPELLRGSIEEVQKNISLVLFTGGADVDPSLYGERKPSFTYCNYSRDYFEVKEFIVARRYGLPMVGVCRGAQFLCVMSGGKLVQHCESHSGDHDCKLWNSKIISVSSTHHQMQIPPKDAQILGVAYPSLSDVYLDGEMNNLKLEQEVEIAYYPLTRSLGMQHHPEMQSSNSDGFKIASELVEQFLKPS